MQAEPPTNDQIGDFFSETASAFKQAAERVGTRSKWVRLGDQVIRLEFAGESLVSTCTRALAHLEIPPSPLTHLNVHIWEIAETGIPLPHTRWDAQAYKRRGEVQGFNDGTRFTMFHQDSGLLYLYNSMRGEAFITAFERDRIPVYECAAALRPILFPWLATLDIQYVHAAAVGMKTGGALLVGKSGMGKSTTALGCLDSELFYAADDYCAVHIDENPRVDSLYNSGKASAETIQRLPFLEPHIQFWDRGGSEKAIFFIHETLPDKLILKFPLRAILIPRITGESFTRVSRATAHEALLALAPSTVSQLATADAQALRRLKNLVQRVPCWHLELGTEMRQIPETIAELLERA